jgi:LCP family protein required for cell wall assembly
VVVWREGASGLIEVLVQPRWLWALVAANGLLAVIRVGATADAWLSERSAPGHRPRLTVVAAALTLVTLLPHVLVHAYAVEALDLLGTVFATEQPAALGDREADLLAAGLKEEDLGPPAPMATSSTVPATTTVTAPSTTAPPAASSTTTTTAAVPTSTTEAPSTTTTTALPSGEDLPGDRITILLAGGDFGPGRHDLRTDVMIVASLDVAAGRAALVSVSRDLVEAPLPAAWAEYSTMLQTQQWHEDRAFEDEVAEAEAAGEPPPEREPFVPCRCYADRLNYLHVHTGSWVRTFPDSPDPGMEALLQTLEILLGIPIDFYVLVDFAGFVDLIDAIGGVHVTVTEPMDVAFSPAREGEDPVSITVEAGRHLFDGHQALAYVRNRTGSSDHERMRRQRCMIRELSAELDAVTLLGRFPQISEAIQRAATTTVPLDLLPDLIAAAAGLELDEIATLAISSPRFAEGANYMNLPIVNAGRVRAAVADLLAGVAAGTSVGDALDECP